MADNEEVPRGGLAGWMRGTIWGEGAAVKVLGTKFQGQDLNTWLTMSERVQQ